MANETSFENLREENRDLTSKYILFELKKEYLALSLKYVQEVLDVEKARKLPRLSNKFVGIVNLRGEILPIVYFQNCVFNEDLRIESTKNIKTIVLRLGHELFGIVVDKILDIFEMQEEFSDDIPSAVQTKIPFKFIDNILNIRGNIVKMISIQKVISEQLFLKLDEEIAEIAKTPAQLRESKSAAKTAGSAKPVALKLTKDQLDAMREIGNIATGKAASAMGKLFKNKTQVGILVDQVLIKDLKNVEKGSPLQMNTKVVGIRATVKNDLNASLFLILPLEQLSFLLENLEGIEKAPKSITSEDQLDKNMRDALLEFGNIIISHYCIGLSDFLKIQVMHDVPEMAFDEYGSLIDGDISKAAEQTDQVLFLQTQIQTKEKMITGALMFIPDYDSIQNFVEWIDVDTIVGLMNEEAAGKSPQELQKAQVQKAAKAASPAKATTPAKATAPVKVEPAKPVAPAKVEPVKPAAPAKAEAAPSTVDEVFNKVQFQKDYKMADLDKKELKITEGDLDTFRELGNIGAGNAGNALSQMLNKKVYLEIPPAKVLSLTDLNKMYTDKSQNFVGYIGSTKGFFESNIVLLFDTDHIENLLQIIMETDSKKTLNSEADLGSNEKSAVMELLNILLGHYIAAMSDFLKSQIDPPEYQFFFKRGKQVFASLESNEENKNMKAVVVETSINVSDAEPIRGLFIMLLHPKIVNRIIERINQIW